NDPTLRSTPTAGMEAVLGIIPLDLFLQAQATKSRWRTKHFLQDTWDGIGDLPKRRGHRFSSDKLLTQLQLNQSSDYIKGSRTWINNQEVNKPDIVIYTDGSKDENGNTGAGWAITRGDTSLHHSFVSLNKEATVFQAEVFAIAQSIETLTRMEKPSANVVIRSDSQSAIAAILNPFTKSDVVKRCQKIMHEVKKEKKIHLDWCKGHSDVTGNEFADCLAKSGTESQNRKIVGTSPSYIKKKVNDFFYAAWCNRYKKDQSMKHTHLMLEKPQQKIVKYERENLKLIVQAYTGHGPFLAHLSKWKKSTDGMCNVCMEETQSADHLINRCPALSYERHDSSQEEDEVLRILKLMKCKKMKKIIEENYTIN
ncbi:Uncharacterized protein FKW44_000207, partial [Caligus rogercresseyi]